MKNILIKEIVGPILIVVISIIVYMLLKKIVDKLFKIRTKKIDNNKKKMVTGLITNILKYFIIVIAFLMILDIYGVDTKALITSLGVLGLVAGLAVQDTLKDFVTGVSIILEDQYKIGDTIKINGFKGEVVVVGMKTTRVKAYTGELLIIPNHLITEVVNYSHDNSLAIIDVSISYESNLDEALKVLNQLCEEQSSKIDGLKGNLQVLGVNNLGESSVDIRIIGETKPMQHFAVEREMKKQVKKALDSHGISIPYPQLEIHNGKRV